MNKRNTVNKIQEQVTEAVKNPQEFVSNLNSKNQEFAKEAQQFLMALPQEVLSQQKEAQERISTCAKKIQEIITAQPVDFIQIQQTLFQFHVDSFNYQTKIAQEQLKKTQELFETYTK